MASIEREVELALINAVSGASIPHAYTSERSAGRLLPNMVAKATISNELLGPFTGVFTLSANLIYTSRADTTSRAGFDHEVQTIIEELYSSPSLPSTMTSSSNLTVYNASISSEGGTILARNRTWQRTISLDIKASAKKAISPFFPTDLAGLQLWLKADAGVTLAGSVVTGWQDQSGNGNNATPINSPYYIASFINSKPAIDFVTDLDISYFNLTNNIDPIKTIFALFKADTTPTSYHAIVEGNFGIYSSIAGGKFGAYTNTEIGYDYLTANTAYILMAESDDGITSAGYINGQYKAPSTNGTGFEERGYVQIGAGQDGAQPCSGYISEVIIYDRVLTSTERGQVTTYLNNKYAIY